MEKFAIYAFTEHKNKLQHKHIYLPYLDTHSNICILKQNETQN